MSDANNGNKARDLYIKRNKYKMNTGFAIKNTYVNEGLMVGKIDLSDFPIVPIKNKLIDLDSISTNAGRRVYALNFVRLAFDSMNLRFQDGVANGKVSVATNNETPLTTFKAYSGYQSPVDLYREYMNYFIVTTKTFLKDPIENKKVDTFRKYLEAFFFVTKQIINTSPVLYSDFIVSKKNSQMTSGLMIEIDEHSYDNDAYKTQYYYNNPNFTYVNNLAVSFGFRIDKNIPWRFIADINSPQMRYYMRICDRTFENYYLETTQRILARYYTRVFDDYSIFVNILYNGYIDFLQNYPSIKKYDLSPCAKTNEGKIVLRDVNSNLNITNIKYIFSEFVDVKNIFHDFKLSLEEKIIIKNKLNNLLNTSSILSASAYLANIFNSNNNMHGSINHTMTNLSLMEDEESLDANQIITQNIKNIRINKMEY